MFKIALFTLLTVLGAQGAKIDGRGDGAPPPPVPTPEYSGELYIFTPEWSQVSITENDKTPLVTGPKGGWGKGLFKFDFHSEEAPDYKEQRFEVEFFDKKKAEVWDVDRLASDNPPKLETKAKVSCTITASRKLDGYPPYRMKDEKPWIQLGSSTTSKENKDSVKASCEAID